MACPFFTPTELLRSASWIQPPRLPLGVGYRGWCSAPAEEPQPDARTMEECCNTGYARGRCSRFPAAERTDAVRISRHNGGLVWVLEADHWPVAYGRYPADAPPSAAIEAQLRCFQAGSGWPAGLQQESGEDR